jgi:hypothetical protein
MDSKLIVALTCLRSSGKIVPKHNLAFTQPFRGVLTLSEEHLPNLHRHALVARLRDPLTNAPIDALPPLIDARLIRATADEWVITGFERVMISMQECDCAQTWVARMEQLLVDNHEAAAG